MSDNRFRERRSAYIEENGPSAPGESEVEPFEATAARPTAEVTESPEVPETAGGGQVTRELDDMGVDLPEPSFLEIVQYLTIQAIQFLGDMPLNEEGERSVMPNEAKHFIDLLGVLEERTRGNLTPEEARYLEQILADLRLRYLQVDA